MKKLTLIGLLIFNISSSFAGTSNSESTANFCQKLDSILDQIPTTVKVEFNFNGAAALREITIYRPDGGTFKTYQPEYGFELDNSRFDLRKMDRVAFETLAKVIAKNSPRQGSYEVKPVAPENFCDWMAASVQRIIANEGGTALSKLTQTAKDVSISLGAVAWTRSEKIDSGLYWSILYSLAITDSGISFYDSKGTYRQSVASLVAPDLMPSVFLPKTIDSSFFDITSTYVTPNTNAGYSSDLNTYQYLVRKLGANWIINKNNTGRTDLNNDLYVFSGSDLSEELLKNQIENISP